MDAFGEVRSLVMGEPSKAAFIKLAMLVDKVSEQELEEAWLPYLLDHLSRWPDVMRILVKPWFDDAVAGKDHARHELVRTLLPWGTYEFHEGKLERLQQNERLRPTVVVLSHSAIRSLRTLERWSIKELRVSFSGELVELDLPQPERLEILRAHHMAKLSLAGLERFHALKVLDLAYPHAGAFTPERLGELEALTQLEELRLDADPARTPQALHGLEFLGPKPRLRELSMVSWPHLRSLEAAAGLQALERLDVRGCTGLTDLEPLKRLSHLKAIVLTQDQESLRAQASTLGLPVELMKL